MSGRQLKRRLVGNDYRTHYGNQFHVQRLRRAKVRRGGARGKFYHVNRLPSGKQGSNMMIWRGPGFVPQSYFTQFDYQALYKMTDATGFYDWVIRANSCYDPDVSLGGDSVTGWSAISEIYVRYKVLAARIDVSVVNNDSDDPIYVCLVPTNFDSAFAVANKATIEGQPYAKCITVANQAGAGSLTNYSSSKVMFGVTNLDSVNFSAAVTANPATVWYWHFVVFNNSGNALAAECKMHVTFFTEMSSLKAYEQ